MSDFIYNKNKFTKYFKILQKYMKYRIFNNLLKFHNSETTHNICQTNSKLCIRTNPFIRVIKLFKNSKINNKLNLTKFKKLK